MTTVVSRAARRMKDRVLDLCNARRVKVGDVAWRQFNVNGMESTHAESRERRLEVSFEFWTCHVQYVASHRWIVGGHGYYRNPWLL